MDRAQLVRKLYRYAVAVVGGDDTPGFMRRLAPPTYLEIFGSVFPDLTTADAEKATSREYPRDVARGLRLLQQVVIRSFYVAVPVEGVKEPDPENPDHWLPGGKMFDEETVEVISDDELGNLGNAILGFSGLNPEVSRTASTFQEEEAPSDSPGTGSG